MGQFDTDDQSSYLNPLNYYEQRIPLVTVLYSRALCLFAWRVNVIETGEWPRRTYDNFL